MKLTPLLLIVALALSGCNKLDRITGSEKDEAKNPQESHAFYVVSCCRDNDGQGNMSYPSFVPESHVQLCESARMACHNNDCQINGATYLAMNVDCERDYKIGSEYYKGKGY